MRTTIEDSATERKTHGCDTRQYFAQLTKDPANPYSEYGEARLKQTLAKLELARPIGSRFEYSNLGVGLLGHALSHAAKTKSYEELLLQR